MYGVINMISAVMTVCAIAATMGYLNVALNPITATTLSITVGIGVDYTIHMVYRITDEVGRKSNVDRVISESVMGDRRCPVWKYGYDSFRNRLSYTIDYSATWSVRSDNRNRYILLVRVLHDYDFVTV
jgi:hypothetical protein